MDEATHKTNFKPINLRELFMDENPGLGKSIPDEAFHKRHTPLEWVWLVKDHIYIGAEDPDREFSYIKN